MKTEKPKRIYVDEKTLRSVLLSGNAMQSCIERKDLSSADTHVRAWELATAELVQQINGGRR